LVAGFTDEGKPVYIVCAEMENDLLIVTVYIPTPPKFKNIYERGFFMKKACHFCGNKNLKQVSIQYTYTHDNKYHYCQWGSL